MERLSISFRAVSPKVIKESLLEVIIKLEEWKYDEKKIKKIIAKILSWTDKNLSHFIPVSMEYQSINWKMRDSILRWTYKDISSNPNARALLFVSWLILTYSWWNFAYNVFVDSIDENSNEGYVDILTYISSWIPYLFMIQITKNIPIKDYDSNLQSAESVDQSSS